MERYIQRVYLDYIFNPHIINDINPVYIPMGLIPLYQPLDISINKIFKDEMKKQYLVWSSYLIKCDVKVTR